MVKWEKIGVIFLNSFHKQASVLHLERTKVAAFVLVN